MKKQSDNGITYFIERKPGYSLKYLTPKQYLELYRKKLDE